MGFSSDDILHLFKIIMAVLQVGDIIFAATRDGEGSQIANSDVVEQVCVFECLTHAEQFLINAFTVDCKEIIRQWRSFKLCAL